MISRETQREDINRALGSDRSGRPLQDGMLNDGTKELTTALACNPVESVHRALAYHRRTKHHLNHYATCGRRINVLTRIAKYCTLSAKCRPLQSAGPEATPRPAGRERAGNDLSTSTAALSAKRHQPPGFARTPGGLRRNPATHGPAAPGDGSHGFVARPVAVPTGRQARARPITWLMFDSSAKWSWSERTAVLALTDSVAALPR